MNQSTVHQMAKPSLAKRIGASPLTGGKPTLSNKMFCKQCKRCNHYTQDCMYLGMDKCDECGRFGHLTKHCWNKQMHQKRKGEGNATNRSNRPPKRTKQEETNSTIEECLAVMEEESEKDIVIGETDEELIVFSTEERGNNNHYSLNGNGINVPLLPSDWLADSATKSHVTNQQEWLEDYLPTPDLTVIP